MLAVIEISTASILCGFEPALVFEALALATELIGSEEVVFRQNLGGHPARLAVVVHWRAGVETLVLNLGDMLGVILAPGKLPNRLLLGVFEISFHFSIPRRNWYSVNGVRLQAFTQVTVTVPQSITKSPIAAKAIPSDFCLTAAAVIHIKQMPKNMLRMASEKNTIML
jgi:hypothetical protein